MGKTLQQLVHRIVPSWLSKTQSPTCPSSTRYLIPWLGDGSNNTTSGKSPSTSAASAMAEDTPEFVDRSARRHLFGARSSSSSPRTKLEVQNGDSSHPQEEFHHQSEDIKPQPQHHKLQDLLLQDGMCPQWQDDDQNSILAAEPELGNTSSSQMHREALQETAGSSGYYEAVYQEMVLGLKRKTQSLHSNGEEEEEGGNSTTKWWAGKRRKGEAGLTSCELPESICSIVGNGRAVVKQTLDPQLSLWESMVEMIVGNGLWELGSLDFLLLCYLSLNEPHLHPIIHSSFLQVLKDLHKIP